MDKVPENYTEAWGFLTRKVNELVEKVNELDIRTRKHTPEELKALRIENLKKARASK